MSNIRFSEDAWEEYQNWITHDRKSLKRISELLKDTQRSLPRKTWSMTISWEKGAWLNLSLRWKTTLLRPAAMGDDDKTGEKILVKQERVVPDTELKAMMGSYKVGLWKVLILLKNHLTIWGG